MERWGAGERDFLARDMNYLVDGGGEEDRLDKFHFPLLFKGKVSKFVDAGEEENATPVSYVPPLTPLRTYFKMLCIAKANSGKRDASPSTLIIFLPFSVDSLPILLSSWPKNTNLKEGRVNYIRRGISRARVSKFCLLELENSKNFLNS